MMHRALLVAAVCAAGAAARGFEPLGVVVENTWIVDIKKDARDAEVAELLAAVGQHEDLSFGGHDAALGRWRGYRGLTFNHDDAEVVEAVRRLPAVANVYADEEFELVAEGIQEGVTPDLQTGEMSWGTQRVTSDGPVGEQFPSMGFLENGASKHDARWGEGVDVYVMDTGTRCTHEDFEDRCVWLEGANIAFDQSDAHGHGSHVAGTVGGKRYGIAKSAMIYPVRVGYNSGSPTNFKRGFKWIMEQVKKSGRPSVINFSWAFPSSMIPVLNGVTEAGVHLAVASGNERRNACRSALDGGKMAALDWIHVCATRPEDDQLWYSSNYGSCVDICAPGQDIWSASHEGDDLPKRMSGTSMATPHVAGAIAAYLSMEGNAWKTPAQVKQWLIEQSLKDMIPNPRWWEEPPLDGTPNRILHLPTSPVVTAPPTPAPPVTPAPPTPTPPTPAPATPTPPTPVPTTLPPTPTPTLGAVSLSLRSNDGASVRAQSGTITDGYNIYPHGMDQAVTVLGENCRVSWTAFLLEAPCQYDSVTITDEDGLPLTGALCGGNVPAPVVAPRGFTVRMRTDSSVAFPGFALEFVCGGATETPKPTTAVPTTPEPTTPEPTTPEPTSAATSAPPTQAPETPAPATPEPTTAESTPAPTVAGTPPRSLSLADDNGGIFVATSGSITDGYSRYPAFTDRSVSVEGSNCLLKWKEMSLESSNTCQFDAVTVMVDGAVVVKACGQTPPADTQLSGDGFTLRLKADGSQHGGGFEMEFVCDGAAAVPSGPPAATGSPACVDDEGSAWCETWSNYCEYSSFQQSCAKTCKVCA